jgi:hypothetical protein
VSIIGHAKWCDRKGQFANMSGNYCSTCGQVVLLKTGKTEEERSLEAQLAGAVKENERLRERIASLVRCHGKRVEMAQPKVDEMTFTDDHGGQFS